MKTLALTLFFTLICSFGFSQKQEVFRIDSLPKQGVLLDRGWRWHAGDNPDFSKADFDDSAWKSIDPTKELSELPEVFDPKIKWLRIDFEIKSKFSAPLGITVNQAGASELYLNGQLFYRYGHFDTDSSKVIAYDPKEVAIHIPADTIGHYTLAVRYCLQPNIRYTNTFAVTNNRLFYAHLVDLVPTLQAQREFYLYFSGMDIFIFGITFLLGILHLFLYLYNKNNKTQLVLTLYLFGTFVCRILKVIGQNQHSVEDRYFTLNIANLLLGFALVTLANVIYRMAKMRLDIFYKIMLAFQAVYVTVAFFSYGYPWQTLLLLTGTFYSFFLLIRAARRGIKNGIKGFKAVAMSVSIGAFSLFWISAAVLFLGYGNSHIGFNELKYGVSPDLIALVFNVSSLAIPIGLSIFMGIQGNETNKVLRSQLYENEQLKIKAIKQEQEKQHILETQNETLEKLVNERTAELKASQSQLIQKEKLASLGELTAGIAHEIQNPLNFVNNFSELSGELLNELKSPLTPDGGIRDGEKIDMDLMDDLTQNLEKINHHGKRASSIVKGMLEHSRMSTGERVLTDLNALADEYLRLSYHGMRAKNKQFNTDYELIVDPNLPKINVVPQDIGRVLLNLMNNAFWAVKTVEKPFVVVKTEQVENLIMITVKDNGTGMSDEIKAKIFQPFFTTKPTGEGTGLGLSLSYDIITKGHGGTLEVESVEGEGTTFVVSLPAENA